MGEGSNKLFSLFFQEDNDTFPPKDVSLVDGSIPIPRINWSGMVPGGILKLLPIPLWLCIQYLGTRTLVETVSYCQNLVCTYTIAL